MKIIQPIINVKRFYLFIFFTILNVGLIKAQCPEGQTIGQETQWVTSATGNANTAWGTNAGVVGASDVYLTGGIDSVSKHSSLNSSTAGIYTFTNGFTAGDTVTVYAGPYSSTYSGSNISVTLSVDGVTYTSSIGTIATSAVNYSAYTFVVPAGLVDDYTKIKLVDNHSGSITIIDAISTTYSACVCDVSIANNDCDGDGILNGVDCEPNNPNYPTSSADYDSDGIPDDCDLDDDNDGILDLDECSTAGQNLVTNGGFSVSSPSGWYMSSTTSAFSTSTGAIYTYANLTKNSTLTGGLFDELNGVNTSSGLINVLYELNSYNAAVVYNFNGTTLSAGTYNYAFDLGSRSIGSTSDSYVVQIWNADTNTLAVELERDTFSTLPNYTATPNFATYSGSFNLTSSGHYYLLFRGTGSGSTPDDYLIDRVAIEAASTTVCDIDGDGIPNQLDLDSDNDGCPDAIEGGGSVLLSQIADSSIPGGNISATSGTYFEPVIKNICLTATCGSVGVSSSGLPQFTSLPADYSNTTGQTIGTSQDATQQDPDCVINPCTITLDNPDSDGDGVSDACDLDDDNDGILDTDEQTICYALCEYTPATDAGTYKRTRWTGSDEGSAIFGANNFGTIDPTYSNMPWRASPAATALVTAPAGFISESPTNSTTTAERYVAESYIMIPTCVASGDVMVHFTNAGNGLYGAYISPDLDPANATLLGVFNNPQPGSVTGQIGSDITYQFSNTTLDNIAAFYLRLYVVDQSNAASVRGWYSVDGGTNWLLMSNDWFSGSSTDAQVNYITYSPDGNGNYTDGTTTYTEAELIALGATQTYCDKDTDNDGIVDRLDLDSDNDGCLDALEGGENVTTTDLVDASGTVSVGTGSSALNQNLGTTVDSDGVPTVVNSGGTADTGSATEGTQGQGVGDSQNATVANCTTACYNDPNSSAGVDTKHGITSLKRAGGHDRGDVSNSTDWPMIRKSAHTILESNTKGFVITRMSSPETTIGTNAEEGMMVYDTDDKCLKIYNGTQWDCYTIPSCP